VNRIDERFKELRKRGATAFMPFITAGDPDLETSFKILEAAQGKGASLVELGIPFSDPIADGPVIQSSFTRALARGVNIDEVFEKMRSARRRITIPVVSMLSFSIVFRVGVGRFVREADEAGFDGAIIPDLPVEEAKDVCRAAGKRDFKIISLIAPNTPAGRRKKLVSFSGGFIYYMSVVGITGTRDELPAHLREDIRGLRKLTSKPICVGFGIKDGAQARVVASVADGVIVGSALVRVVERWGGDKKRLLREAKRFISSIAGALKG